MWSTVELRELRLFLVLAEELHFRRAAGRLGITPSRASQVLRELEAKLGAPLVHRTSRRVRLTALGERLRAELAETCALLDGALERIEASGREGDGRLRIGTFSGTGTGPHFTQILREFSARHPACEVDVQPLPRPESPIDPLERGEFDVLATWLPSDHRGLVIGPILVREPRVLAVSPDNPLADRASVSLEEVADHRVVRIAGLAPEFHDAWVPARTPSGRPIPSEPMQMRSLAELLLELGYRVAAGRVVHPTVPSVALAWGNLDIVYVPIADMPPLESALVWRRGAADATVREFVRTARQVLREANGSTRRPERDEGAPEGAPSASSGLSGGSTGARC